MRFRREHLPPARHFYERELGQLRQPSRNWTRPESGCPFHESRSKSSFVVNLDSGGFYCFGCGAKGGDVIDYIRLRDGCDFKTACQKLGCWSDAATPARKVRTRAVPYLVMDYAIDGVSYRAEVPDEPRSESELHHRLYNEAKDRLNELRQGDPERFESEEDVQWGILASSWELIRMDANVE